MYKMDDNIIFDFLKHLLPISFIFGVVCIVLFLPISYTEASQEFKMYKIQQFKFLQNTQHNRMILFNLDIKSIYYSHLSTKHAVLVNMKDLANLTSAFYSAVSQAGLLLIVLPSEIDSLPKETLLSLAELEKKLISEELDIPIFFLKSDNQLQNMINEIDLHAKNNDKKTYDSAFDVVANNVLGESYQLSVRMTQSSVVQNAVLPVIQGKLMTNNDVNSPTIILVANYDSYGIVPELSFGADSNGSGVAAILELARVFSKLYSNSKTRPHYNLMFVLTGGGTVNYIGTKKWIDLVFNDREKQPKNIAFVICLNSLASNNDLAVHFSKLPKDDSQMGLFVKALNNTDGEEINVIHKKINLIDKIFDWEHERFSMKKIPALTISAIKDHKYWKRKSVFDVPELADMKKLHANVIRIAEAVGNIVYNRQDTGKEIFSTYKIEYDSLAGWFNVLASQSRAMQLLSGPKNPLVTMLNNTCSNYLNSCEVKMVTSDKNNPEFVFYNYSSPSYGTVYNVKPATFDLVLTVVIGGYIFLITIFIKKFHLLYSLMPTSNNKIKLN